MGRRIIPEGIYYGDDSWFRDHHFSWFPDTTFKCRNWQFGRPEDHQSVKLTSKINERVSIKPDIYETVGLASAVYNAQILKGNEIMEDGIIVKTFMRYEFFLFQI